MNPPPAPPIAPSSRRWAKALCALLLVLQAILTFDSMRQESLTVDEGGHIAAGVAYLRYGAFHVYPENPPLLRLLVAIPMFVSRARTDLSPDALGSHNWMDVHDEFMQKNGANYQTLLIRARAVIVGLALLGGLLVFIWGRSLFGEVAGLVALSMWVFSPAVLAHGGLATIDMGAAFFFALAMFAAHRYARAPRARGAALVGAALGLALLTKFTALLLVPIVAVIVVSAAHPRRRLRAASIHLATIGVVALVVVDAGYGFDGLFRPLGDLHFNSRTLTPAASYARESAEAVPFLPTPKRGNVFRGTWLASVPLPLPRYFIEGFDSQKSHVDRHIFPAYLRGKWHADGLYPYYVYGLLVKTPIGAIALFLLAVGSAIARPALRADFRSELCWLLPAAAVLGALTVQTGLNAHVRYTLPMLPLVVVGTSRVGRTLERGFAARCWGLAPVAVIIALVGGAASVLRYHPHHLAYFNEAAGGPDHGADHLLDSNIDWGQDLVHLRRWLDQHTEVDSLGLAYFGTMDPGLLAIRYHVPRWGRPDPGWYAVSVNFVRGMTFQTYDEHGGRVRVPKWVYGYFDSFAPVGKAGYSIFIYHLTEQDVTRFAEQHRDGVNLGK